MTPNELKKGTVVFLRNGWKATLEDNMRGNTRLATVEGFVTETGSIYAHNIVYAIVKGKRTTVEYTPSMLKCRRMVGAS